MKNAKALDQDIFDGVTYSRLQPKEVAAVRQLIKSAEETKVRDSARDKM